MKAASGFADLLQRMSKTAFGARQLGEAYRVLKEMAADDACKIVVTVSGAMTIAKQGLLVCEMIERGWVQAVVTTGALMTHGFVEGAGLQHFKHRDGMRDEDLYQREGVRLSGLSHGRTHRAGRVRKNAAGSP